MAYPRRMKLLTKQAKVKAKDKLTYQEKKTRQAQHKHEVKQIARTPVRRQTTRRSRSGRAGR